MIARSSRRFCVCSLFLSFYWLGADHLDAANTIDPNSIGATDVAEVDPNDVATALSNPLADPLDLGGNGLMVGNTADGALLVDSSSVLSIDELRVANGNGATGTLSIVNGGAVSAAEGWLGFSVSTTAGASVDGAGSQWTNAGELRVGRNGTATLDISNGGTVSNTEGFVGSNSTGDGTVNVTDPNSRWINSDDLSVGSSGLGKLTISNGGLVSNTRGFLGRFAGGDGTVTVTGAGSTWNNSDSLYVGGSPSAANGTATLNINSGGTVTSSDTLKLWNTGTVNLDGGSLSVQSFDNSDVGSFNHTDGTLTVDGGTFDPGTTDHTINSSGGSSVLALDNGASGSISGDLIVGDDGSGTLSIQNGGMVTNTNGFVGNDPNSIGIVTVNGASSQWDNSGELSVGEGSTGTLTISGGGQVTNTVGYLGFQSSGDGTVNVADPNSRWANSADLYVGDGGTGTVNITGGGQVTNADSYIANLNVSTVGEVNVSGADSLWENAGDLYLGNRGSGTLNVTAGGSVINFRGIIGELASSVGAATVTGTNSHWNNSSSLTVGSSGTGTLQITDGGLVTSEWGFLGLSAGGDGTVTVSGANSHWRIVRDPNAIPALLSGSLFVGSASGSGGLIIENGAQVSVENSTAIVSGSWVDLDDGRFEFGTIDLNSYSRISGTSGELAGALEVAQGLTALSTIASVDPTISNLDTSEVFVRNEGILYGSGLALLGLHNTSTGEVRTLSGEWARFGGAGFNSGEINNFGGVVEFENDFTNEANGFVAGRGQFIAGDGWTNDGVMAFSGGFADVLRDVANSATGQISIGGNSVTTFYDDVTMDPNNLNIDVASGSTAVFLGSYNGGNDGAGAVDILGDLRPGNSPALVNFGGDLNLASSADTFIELGGLLSGEFDALNIAGDLSLDGELLVSLLGGFTLDSNMEFLIADVDGTVAGTFNGLADGDLVATLGGIDLFINYDAGDGNDIVLFTVGLPGDFDGNGSVDGLDFLVWQRGESPNPLSQADLIDWQTNFGTTSGITTSTNVPEPSGSILAAMAIVALAIRSSRRTSR